MAKYLIDGQVNLLVYLSIEADSKEEALKIADEKYGQLGIYANNLIGFDGNDDNIVEFEQASFDVEWSENVRVEED